MEKIYELIKDAIQAYRERTEVIRNATSVTYIPTFEPIPAPVKVSRAIRRNTEGERTASVKNIIQHYNKELKTKMTAKDYRRMLEAVRYRGDENAVPESVIRDVEKINLPFATPYWHNRKNA